MGPQKTIAMTTLVRPEKPTQPKLDPNIVPPRRHSATRVKPLPKPPDDPLTSTTEAEKSPRKPPPRPRTPSPQHQSPRSQTSDDPNDQPIREMPTESLKSYSEMLENLKEFSIVEGAKPRAFLTGNQIDDSESDDGANNKQPGVYSIFLSTTHTQPENLSKPISEVSSEHAEYKALMANMHNMEIKASPRKPPSRRGSQTEHSPRLGLGVVPKEESTAKIED